jgi:hypothetical protein
MEEEFKMPIHLICNHCQQIVQTGIANVIQHSYDCPVYEEFDVYPIDSPLHDIKLRYRPNPSYTPIYNKTIISDTK